MRTLAFAALALVACGTEYQPPDSGTSTPAAAVEKYMENCSSCHGEHGEGTVDGPQIQNPVRGYATWVIRNGRTVQMTEMHYTDEMPAHNADDVSDADIKGILDYLSQPAHPTDGHGLYLRFCGNCHGQTGTGGRVGESAVGESDDAYEKVREGEGHNSYNQRTKYMPSWSKTALSDAEVALIVGWLDVQPGGGGDGGEECVSPEDCGGDDGDDGECVSPEDDCD